MPIGTLRTPAFVTNDEPSGAAPESFAVLDQASASTNLRLQHGHCPSNPLANVLNLNAEGRGRVMMARKGKWSAMGVMAIGDAAGRVPKYLDG